MADTTITTIHCSYCIDDARVRGAAHCTTCGYAGRRLEVDELGRCTDCVAWARGERPMIDDHEVVAGFVTAIVERAVADVVNDERRKNIPRTCECGERTRLCGVHFMNGLRIAANAHEGDMDAVMQHVVTIATQVAEAA